MKKKRLSGGLAHDIPPDLAHALSSSTTALAAWENITVKARNEWICWTISVKQEKTRRAHIRRAVQDLSAGKRRPCCWVGCIHRTDKPISPWAQRVLIDKLPRKS